MVINAIHHYRYCHYQHHHGVFGQPNHLDTLGPLLLLIEGLHQPVDLTFQLSFRVNPDGCYRGQLTRC